MKFRNIFVLTVALMAGAGAASAATPTPTPAEGAFTWPHGVRAAVSLAYDDALNSQLDNAIPALDKHGLKGSFYLQLSNATVVTRLADWRAAASHGHELGNHSLFHQCSRKAAGHEWVQPHRNLDTMSVAQMKDQILVGNAMLTAIDGKRTRTYTVPCGDTEAGGVSYLPAIKDAFVAIKAGGGGAVTPTMRGLDPYGVQIMSPVGLSGQQLIAIVRQAGERGTMVNFTFHGVGGDYLSTSAAAHDELLRFLAEHREEYWTDTFLNIMTYVKQQK